MKSLPGPGLLAFGIFGAFTVSADQTHWNVQGTPGPSRLTGVSSGENVHGTYESQTPDGTTHGTWTVRKK